MAFRDYLYLDTNRLEDYLSHLDKGDIESIRDTSRTLENEESVTDAPPLNEPVDDTPGRTETENVQERILRISAKHQFDRLYKALQNEIVNLDRDKTPPVRQSIVELTRDFEPSPVSQMIESLLQLTDMIQGMGVVDVSDTETQEAMNAMTMLFRREGQSEDVPMLSRVEDSEYSILFSAKRKHLLCEADVFEGEMTLVGKVQQVVPPGKSVDLFDLLKVLPRSLRRGKKGGNDLREAIVGLFESWPDELGGALSKDAMELHGPALFVSPLAVFE